VLGKAAPRSLARMHTLMEMTVLDEGDTILLNSSCLA
jgi:hypothetical protein